jgi:uncharacterized cysteine cluster protein YcgN (CxxCxxCC family)
MSKKSEKPFWETKSLDVMSREEWESLCDGCGRCCLVKLLDDDTEEVYYTMASCALLDVKACSCKNYAERTELIDDCVELTPENIDKMDWLPPTCAYRKVREGKPLSWWHPLVSGSPETVHEAGISVRGKIVSETLIAEEDLWGARVNWPLLEDGIISGKRNSEKKLHNK